MPNEEPKLGKELTPEEEKELRDGNALAEMVSINAGWKIIEDILKQAAFHTWVNPLECESEKQFVWRELVAYSASKNAETLLETISQMISRAKALKHKQSGEDGGRNFRI